MKWLVSYLIKTVPNMRIILKDDPNLRSKDYNTTEANTADEAIEDVKNYIAKLFRCNCLTVEETEGKLIVYESSKEEIIDEYFDFQAKRIYNLIGRDGKPYQSYEPGTLGGHKKLKIYGRLDCPSALRYIQKGQYVQHRVFFADEETAIAAGYRPCAVCMPEKYKEWKMAQEKRRK